MRRCKKKPSNPQDSSSLYLQSLARPRRPAARPGTGEALRALCLLDGHVIQVNHHAALLKVNNDRANMIYHYGNITHALVPEVGVQSPVANHPAQSLLGPGDFRICVRVELLFTQVYKEHVSHSRCLEYVEPRQFRELIRLARRENPIAASKEKTEGAVVGHG